MILKNINSALILLLIAFSSTFAQNVSLEIQNVDLEAGTLEVHMANDVAVGGYQFELFGISIVNATAPSGFFGNNSANSMLGFSLSGATIPAGSAILLL